MRGTSFSAGILIAFALALPAAARPERIVSINPCLDTILVNIADADQIAALSHFARDPQSSTIADIARKFPYTHETAEEVIALQPDLVLASRHSSLATRNALNHIGIRTELFTEPRTVDDSLEQIRVMARLIGQENRGTALVARIEVALDAAKPAPGTAPLTALMYQRNGFSTGSGTLVNEMMTRTGFINLAVTYGLSDWGNIPLETVIASPPQVLLAGEEKPGMPTWADRVVHHPALHEAALHMKIATFPDQLNYCGGPVLIQSAAAFARARRLAMDATP